jgi:hypothetical protein
MRRHSSLALLFFALMAQSVFADELTAAKRQDIQKLLAATGAQNLMKQAVPIISQQMFQALKAARPDVPERAMNVMSAELSALITEKMSMPGGFVDLLVPIYAKHYTHQDIRDLITFYQSPVGQKVISGTPQVMTESMAAGRAWGQSLQPDIQKRITAALQREGIINDKKP